MKRLTALDLGFVHVEKRHQPLHVAFLSILSPPPGADGDFAQKLVERLRSHASPLPPFNQRLDSRSLPAFWVTDTEFDIVQHVVHIALPAPGRFEDLMSMVSRMHSSHLDRAYPLWRTYVIEGLEGGRIALYSKVHHAVADGVAGTRLMMRSMSLDPKQILPPPWAVPPRGRRPSASGLLPEIVSRSTQRLGQLVQMGRSLPAIARELRSARQEREQGLPDALSGTQAPASILNTGISASRRFSARSYSLVRAKAAGRALECTVNDIVLGMCSYALRKFLLDMHALPDAPLIAAVPMSTRRDRSDSGNQVGFLLANLATNEADPALRLATIVSSIRHAKSRAQRLKSGEVIGFSLAQLSGGLYNMMVRPKRGKLAFNVIISHVPGPRAAMYWMGCQVEGMYPVSVVVDGMALNLTVTSLEDRLDFGVIACRRSLPRAHHLLDYLEEGLTEIAHLASGGAPELSTSVQTVGRSRRRSRRSQPPAQDSMST